MMYAKRGGCEEAHHTSHMFYIPCNAPATYVIIQRDGNHVAMCDACSFHNIKNRRAKASYPYVDATYRSPWRDNVEFRAAEALREAYQNHEKVAQWHREVRQMVVEQADEATILETLKHKQEILDKLQEDLGAW